MASSLHLDSSFFNEQLQRPIPWMGKPLPFYQVLQKLDLEARAIITQLNRRTTIPFHKEPIEEVLYGESSKVYQQLHATIEAVCSRLDEILDIFERSQGQFIPSRKHAGDPVSDRASLDRVIVTLKEKQEELRGR